MMSIGSHIPKDKSQNQIFFNLEKPKKIKKTQLNLRSFTDPQEEATVFFHK